MTNTWPQHGMSFNRYQQLELDVGEVLTAQEQAAGWYFSNEYDGLLVSRYWQGHELTDAEWEQGNE